MVCEIAASGTDCVYIYYYYYYSKYVRTYVCSYQSIHSSMHPSSKPPSMASHPPWPVTSPSFIHTYYYYYDIVLSSFLITYQQIFSMQLKRYARKGKQCVIICEYPRDGRMLYKEDNIIILLPS